MAGDGAPALHAALGVDDGGGRDQDDDQAVLGVFVDGARQVGAAAEGEGAAGRVVGPGAGLDEAIVILEGEQAAGLDGDTAGVGLQ